MIIEVDDRENSVLNGELEKLGFECVVKRLKVGDYVYKGVCIERKTIDDFCGSIIDGRLEKQVERMKNEFEKNFVLISGAIKDRSSEIKENCILGMMVGLMMKSEVYVGQVDNNKQMAFMIKRICERFDEECSTNVKGGEKNV
jgi:ERCC4-type nuclease